MTAFNFIMRSWPPTRTNVADPGSSRLKTWCYCLQGSSSPPQTARELAGPYKVIKRVSPVAYMLELPPGTNAHPVFHSSLLKAYKIDSTDERVSQVPELISVDGQVEYIVDAVLDERVHHGKKEYLVHWAGYHTNDSTWEPMANVLGSEALVTYQQSSGRGGVL
jgi:Chromo (CHRromatin Organisation MOdifier) domain